MPVVVHAAAIMLTALLCWGVLDGMSQASPRRWLGRAAAWSGVVGGGVYGLGCFDSGLLPGFNWLSLIVIAGGGFLLLLTVPIVRQK